MAIVASDPVSELNGVEDRMKIEVPGVDEKDVEQKLVNNVLFWNGKERFERNTKKENHYRVERSHGSFSQSFTLIAFVNEARVSAKYKDDILSVALPKKETAKPKASSRARYWKILILVAALVMLAGGAGKPIGMALLAVLLPVYALALASIFLALFIALAIVIVPIGRLVLDKIA
jgi:hypothetical protein